MVDRHVRADRVLARIEVLQQEVAAGVLDVAHHARGRVHRALPSHEADATRLVDLNRLRMREARLEGFLHLPLARRAAMPSPSAAPSAAPRASRARGSTAAPSRSMWRR